MGLDKIKIFKIFSLCLMLAGLLWGAKLSIEAKKHIEKNVFYISPIVNDSRYYFSLSDIDRLQNAYEPLTVSFEILKKEQISFNNVETTTKLVLTNAEYFNMSNIQFTDGGAWPKETEWQQMAVISEALAWKLFGNIHVTGEQIKLSNIHYIIAGVVTQDSYTNDDYFVWTPVLPGTERKDTRIGKLYIRPDIYTPLNSYKSVISNITELSHDGNDYRIADMNRYVQSFELRYRLLVLGIGALFICVIIYKMTYFIRIRQKLLSVILFMMLNIFTIIVIVYYIRFDFWIPKFSDDLPALLCQTFFNVGLLPAKEYLSGGILRLYQINLYANIAFSIGILGLLNTIFLYSGGIIVFYKMEIQQI